MKKRSEPLRKCQCQNQMCGKRFEARARRIPRLCPLCKKKFQSQKQMQWRASRDPTIRMGVGSGGRQWGQDNHQWKGGVEVYTKYRGNYRHRCLKRWDRQCVVPGCKHRDIQVHHLNGDVECCESTNLVPLCSKHHWRIHYKRRLTETELLVRFLDLIKTESRIKIAEKIGNPRLMSLAIRGEGSKVKPEPAATTRD